ncbi:MAG TPA: rhomboid family intramembrane serine protease [Candidatus Binataceae bacterium]
MIPLRDNAAPRRLMPVNTSLIVINVLVFLYEVSLGPRAVLFVNELAMVPVRISYVFGDNGAGAGRAAGPWPPITLITSIFLHGGLMHVAGNMLYLFVFGATVEAELGHRRYLLFYLASGIAAGLATVMMAPASQVPVIGASGAIAGVLGAYFVFHPRGRILTILPLLIFVQFIEIPAVIYLMLWFALQLYSGIAEGSGAAMTGGVAWWAHVGGFLFGMALGPLLTRGRKRRKRIR